MELLGLLLSIAVLIFLAFRGVQALPLALLAGLMVALTNGMDLWDSLSTHYISGYVGFIQSYFLIFAASALYAKLMDVTGSAVSIGFWFLRRFGSQHTLLIVLAVTYLLTYGGVSNFIIIFAMAPITYTLFRSADIPRRHIPAVLGIGGSTLTMTAMPGTSQIQNIVPTAYLGTTMTAAPLLGIAASVMLFVLDYFYMQWEIRRSRELGEHFELPPGTDPTRYELNAERLPSSGAAFLPPAVLVTLIIGLQRTIPDSSFLAVLAMLTACVLLVILNWKELRKTGFIRVINDGLSGAVSAIASPCAIVGFGTLVQASPAFGSLIQWMDSLETNPYVAAVVATMVFAGITASASGSLRLTLQAMGESLLLSGADPSCLHRLMTLASGTLSNLPHSSGLFIMMSYNKLSLKECYKSVFITSLVIPTIVTVTCTAVVVLLRL